MCVSVLQASLFLVRLSEFRGDPEMNELPAVGQSGSLGSTMAWRNCAVLLRLTGEDVLRSCVRGGRSVTTAGGRRSLLPVSVFALKGSYLKAGVSRLTLS